MKTSQTLQSGWIALLLNLAILAPCPGSAQFLPQFHLVATSASLAGPNGDVAVPRAHVGETVTVKVMVSNLDTFLDSIAIHRVALVIHHGTGAVQVANLTPDPVLLAGLGDVAEISGSFVVQPEDGDRILVEAELDGVDHWDGLTPDAPLSFHGAWMLQVEVLKPAVAVLQRCDASPLHPFMVISGSVTNSGNTPLENVWVISDSGTPENEADDFPIHIGRLEPNRSASCGQIFSPTGAGSHYTMSVRATDLLGRTVYDSTVTTARTAPATLKITQASATTLRISWPPTAAGFRLESSEDLGAGRHWLAVTNAPVISGNEFMVTVEMSGPLRFYRLASEH